MKRFFQPTLVIVSYLFFCAPASERSRAIDVSLLEENRKSRRSGIAFDLTSFDFLEETLKSHESKPPCEAYGPKQREAFKLASGMSTSGMPTRPECALAQCTTSGGTSASENQSVRQEQRGKMEASPKAAPGLKKLFGFWFASESERQCGENWTPIEVRSTTGMTYGPSPLKPLKAPRALRGSTRGVPKVKNQNRF